MLFGIGVLDSNGLLVRLFLIQRKQTLVSRHHPLEEQVLLFETLAQLHIDHVVGQFLRWVIQPILRSLRHNNLPTFPALVLILLFFQAVQSLDLCEVFGVKETYWLLLFIQLLEITILDVAGIAWGAVGRLVSAGVRAQLLG